MRFFAKICPCSGFLTVHGCLASPGTSPPEGYSPPTASPVEECSRNCHRRSDKTIFGCSPGTRRIPQTSCSTGLSGCVRRNSSCWSCGHLFSVGTPSRPSRWRTMSGPWRVGTTSSEWPEVSTCGSCESFSRLWTRHLTESPRVC